MFEYENLCSSGIRVWGLTFAFDIKGGGYEEIRVELLLDNTLFKLTKKKMGVDIIGIPK